MGWCLARTNLATGKDPICIASGTQTFTLRRDESPGMRLLHLRRWLDDVGEFFGPGDLVLFEQAHHRGAAATALLSQMIGEALAWCAGRGCEHKSVHTSTLKKAVTSKGNADKGEMMAAAERLTGRRPADEHEGDALCLLAWWNMGAPESASKKRKCAQSDAAVAAGEA